MSEDELRDEVSKLRLAKSEKVVVQREKKLKKFDGTKLFTEWYAEASVAIEKLSPDEALNSVTSALEGKALLEVKRRKSADVATAEQVLEALFQVYGDRRSAMVIRREFHATVQGSDDVTQFAQNLMSKVEGCARRLRVKDEDLDIMLRDQFAENVRNPQLRWELMKQIENDTTCSFHDVRSTALDWEAGMRNAGDVSGSRRHHAAPQEVDRVDRLEQMFLQQQETIAALLAQQGEILQNLRKPPDSHGPGRRRGPRCYFCNEYGHIEKNCPQKQEAAKQQAQHGQPGHAQGNQ